MYDDLEIGIEIKHALEKNQPVVALESTIICHGMKYPENLQTAEALETIIRSEGAIPATIAILNGKVKIGLTSDELRALAQNKDVIKVSKRDIGYVLAKKLTGATTVSATMLIAEMAGIRVFATGGIGGVHRGAEISFDISRDLEELASINVAVVCAGVKSILDLEKTLEYLETKGVEVIGYQVDYLPAFYTQNSEYRCSHRLETPEEIALLMVKKWTLGIQGGLVIANPIPKDASMDKHTIDLTIQNALDKAKSLHIEGKALTPFLLKEVSEITHGESLKANIELVKNNARLAARIAIAYTASCRKMH